ncbi:hypothetical protein JZK55_09440 [Dissulfurispira thermophila]|uniref:Uncharacterized protein n=1 Tax=Dissulfurispira thermophila TaxID=2715679 RepID=A0A7G1H1D1_9BACT|nr:hypothetical protein JZK55_09440 [Dissulfurispira thermophila]
MLGVVFIVGLVYIVKALRFDIFLFHAGLMPGAGLRNVWQNIQGSVVVGVVRSCLVPETPAA